MNDMDEIQEIEIPYRAYMGLRLLYGFVAVVLGMLTAGGMFVFNFLIIPYITGFAASNTPTWLLLVWWFTTLTMCFFSAWITAKSVEHTCRQKFLESEEDGTRLKIVYPKSWTSERAP